MTEIAKILGRVYQGFFLRDILGFVAPGSISLLSLWFIFDSKNLLKMPYAAAKLWQDLSVTWRVITFLVAAYLLAWTLQSLHYVILNLIAKLPYFEKKFSELALVDSMNAKKIEKRLKQSPIVTQGAFEPDLVLAKSMTKDMLKDRLKEFPYTERLSALFIMSGNLTIATALFVLMVLICTGNWWWAVGFVVPVFLYIEHWRLWHARNLQVAIYAVGVKSKSKD